VTAPVTIVDDEEMLTRTIDQIVELQRDYFFENKGKETERRKKLRDIIDRTSAAQGN
jgi:hypothetical protein